MLKNVFGDFLLLYKNFIHWNVSKILIHIAAFLFALLLSLPVFWLALLVWYLSPIEWRELFLQADVSNLLWVESMSLHTWYFIGIAILTVLAFLLLFAGFMQYLLTLSKLYLGYIDGEKIPFLGNIYFHFRIFWKYLAYLGWLGLILLIPFVLFLISVVVLWIVFWGEQLILELLSGGTLPIPFLFSSGISFLLALIAFIYISFRFGYWYLPLVDTKNYPELQSGWFYIKESCKLTSGKFWRFVWITIVFFIVIMIPYSIIDGIIVWYINQDIVTFIWTILSFFIIGSAYEMIFVSLYKRLLLKNNDEDSIQIEEQV